MRKSERNKKKNREKKIVWSNELKKFVCVLVNGARTSNKSLTVWTKTITTMLLVCLKRIFNSRLKCEHSLFSVTLLAFLFLYLIFFFSTFFAFFFTFVFSFVFKIKWLKSFCTTAKQKRIETQQWEIRCRT